jgi:NADPH-dependent 2,4-dienoyl-CoA reductase/sulfur reductase-like enzyme
VKHYDVAILGAGPAGLAAARVARGTVALIDDNPQPGGQIWRGAPQIAVPKNVDFLPQTKVFDALPGFTLHTVPHGPIRAAKLILATGARELFLPFPGWTEPNVYGAGGLQALVKSGKPIQGQRVLIAGSGPLLLAVAATLKKAGAIITGIAEQAALGQIVPFLLRYPAKLPQAIALRATLLGVPYWTNTWVTRFANGTATLNNGRTINIDHLATGFGLVPNTEIAQLLGCRLDDGFVVVDSRGQTTVPGVYCAGEPTGIGGLDKALAEGAGQPYNGAFVRDLAQAFALNPALYDLAEPATLICRCEAVTKAECEPYREWRDAKLQTRCGMGACQGRLCGPITQRLFGWTPSSVRPPLVPVPARYLSTAQTPPAPESGRSETAPPAHR